MTGNPVDRVLEALEAHGCRPKAKGDHHQAKCPAHGGKDYDSLTVSRGDDGRVLLACHSRNCSYPDIMHALGLEEADGFERTAVYQGQVIGLRRCPDREELEPEETYDYTDEKGRLLFQVLRYRMNGGKTFRQRTKDESGGWVWSLRGVTRVLYRLPDLRKAIAEHRTVYVVEGEKDVETLRRLGLTATCCCGGACDKPANWLPQYTETLRGAEVAILPDNDEPGRKHANIVLEALEGVAKQVRVVDLPDLPPKGDVSDWVQAGGTAEQLEQLSHEPELVVVDLLDFLQMELPEKELIVEPWLRCQDLVMIHAWRGAGKTWFTGDVAIGIATLSECVAWKVAKQQRVLYVDGELPGAMLQKRFAQIAANKSQGCEHGWFQVLTPDLQPKFRPSLKTPAARARFRDIINLYKPEVIFLDNLSCLYGGEENDAAAWDEMQELLLMLRSDGRAVLLVHHSAKTGVQRGTSRREDVLDTVIHLVRPNDYRNTDGARFEVRFEKVREDASQLTEFEAKLETYTDGSMHWSILDLDTSTAKQMARLMQEGLTKNEAMKELGISRSTAWRAVKKAEEKGWL